MEMEQSLPLQPPTAPNTPHRQVTSPLDKVEGPQLQKTLMIPSAPTDVSATLSYPSSNQASDEPPTKHDPLRPTKQSFFHPPLPYNVMATPQPPVFLLWTNFHRLWSCTRRSRSALGAHLLKRGNRKRRKVLSEVEAGVGVR
jgi:hypothetical protein